MDDPVHSTAMKRPSVAQAKRREARLLGSSPIKTPPERGRFRSVKALSRSDKNSRAVLSGMQQPRQGARLEAVTIVFLQADATLQHEQLLVSWQRGVDDRARNWLCPLNEVSWTSCP
jgi:hypothetical protein